VLTDILPRITNDPAVSSCSVCFRLSNNFTSNLQAANNVFNTGGKYSPKICPFQISVYVYDDLPQEFTTDIERHFFNQTMIQTGYWDDQHTEHALVQLFRSSPCRTNDTSKADIFVVPYMHLSDCFITSRLYGGYGPGCRQIDPKKMQRLFEYLGGKETYISRGEHHLFLTMHNDFMMRKEMTKLPLRIMSSPQENYRPGHIVVPLVNLSPKFQPSKFFNHSDDWWTRPRKFAFSAYYGGMNPRMNPGQPRRFRKYFFGSLRKREKLQKQQQGMMENNKTATSTTTATLGGMPYAVGHLGKSTTNKTVNAYYDAYRNSIFCPILPGDMPYAKRVFDVMLYGCLPVFMRWPSKNREGKSWHVPYGHEAKYTYPFHKELYSFFMRDEDLIDYESFAVEAVGDPGDEMNFGSMFDMMEDMIEENPNEIMERQLILKKQVVSLTYGLGEDAHKYDDAFSRVMKILEHMNGYDSTSA